MTLRELVGRLSGLPDDDLDALAVVCYHGCMYEVGGIGRHQADSVFGPVTVIEIQGGELQPDLVRLTSQQPPYVVLLRSSWPDPGTS